MARGSAGGIRWGRPSAGTIGRMLEAADAAGITYDHVGSTLSPDRWPDRAPHVESLALGVGGPCFAAARDGLNPGRAIGGSMRRSIRPTLRSRWARTCSWCSLPVRCAIVVPDRIVAVVDEPDRFGFAYGTLDGHQERGEEAFLVERLDDDSVLGTVRVDAVAATRSARLAAPVVTRFQHLAVRRYLAALRDHVLAAGA